jgi:hypothetical protein
VALVLRMMKRQQPSSKAGLRASGGPVGPTVAFAWPVLYLGHSSLSLTASIGEFQLKTDHLLTGKSITSAPCLTSFLISLKTRDVMDRLLGPMPDFSGSHRVQPSKTP